MSTDSTADGYSSARGGFSDTEPPSLSLSPPPPGRKVGGGEYSKHWDEANQSYYYILNATGESFWALGDDSSWMEMVDPATQCRYHLHSTSGETKWAEDEDVGAGVGGLGGWVCQHALFWALR